MLIQHCWTVFESHAKLQSFKEVLVSESLATSKPRKEASPRINRFRLEGGKHWTVRRRFCYVKFMTYFQTKSLSEWSSASSSESLTKSTSGLVNRKLFRDCLVKSCTCCVRHFRFPSTSTLIPATEALPYDVELRSSHYWCNLNLLNLEIHQERSGGSLLQRLQQKNSKLYERNSLADPVSYKSLDRPNCLT